MSYFHDHYAKITYPIGSQGIPGGLHNAQLGAIHAIASHFTLSKEPAVITMPTGSGKTAVLMMVPFLFRSNRVLVVTPSRMVRDQIREEFENLQTLKQVGVVGGEMPSPVTWELKSKITSQEAWDTLRNYDVVVSTPNCVSPGLEGVPKPPDDLFDVMLIDEAHHSPASTWSLLIDSFPSIKKVLFTATPYRRDRREIRGKFVYTYPMAKAYEDNIFGKIRYIPVNKQNPTDKEDVILARKAEEVVNHDKSENLKHYLMVRVDSKSRANEIEKIYNENTNLKLQVIHSGHAYGRVKNAIEKLKAGELDGVICVNMLGEGFNFPNLKIAVIHAPHKSLAATLQFIGRFARTNAQGIGEAKFLAVPSKEIEIEEEKLYDEGKIWQDVIIGLSHRRIDEEAGTREQLQSFGSPLAAEVDTEDLSLYSLRPRSHLKIYEISDGIDINNEVSLNAPYELLYSNFSQELSARILIARELRKPKWTITDKFVNMEYDLFIIYFDTTHRLLFINSSRSMDGVYDAISRAIDPGSYPLATSLARKVLKGLNNRNFFSIGLKNILQTSNTESYRIISGSSTQGAIKKSDARVFRQGHAFCTAEENGKRVNIGFSSTAKVWSGYTSQIPQLIKWCRTIGEKIRSAGEVVTNSGFDFIPGGEVVTTIPDGIISADWSKDAYDYNNPLQARYVDDGNQEVECHISDFDLVIDRSQTDQNKIALEVCGDGIKYPVQFSLSTFFTSTQENRILLIRGDREYSLLDYVNNHYINFYTANFSLFTGNEMFTVPAEEKPFDSGLIDAIDWQGVDITHEFGPATTIGRSIHDFIKDRLVSDNGNEIVLYDHGNGEVADYIVVRRAADGVVFQFYHCKGSMSPTPSDRVNDVYEVCGQAQRSLKWVNNIKKLVKKIDSRIQRRNPSVFEKGDAAGLEQILEDSKNLQKTFEVIVVQPGISLASLSSNISDPLAATSNHIFNSGCELFRVWGSS